MQQNLAIAKGNTKLGAVYNISLPPCNACLQGIPCAKTCYARKAWRQYPATRNAWNRNFEIWEKTPMDYMEKVAQFCAAKHIERFRWHVAGDIPSLAYLEGMKLVARCNPETQFLAFTKRIDMIAYPLPENLRLVFSMWPGLFGFYRQKFPKKFGEMTDQQMYACVQSYVPLAWMEPTVLSEDTWYNKELDVVARTHGLTCSGHCDKCFSCWYMEPGSAVILPEH